MANSSTASKLTCEPFAPLSRGGKAAQILKKVAQTPRRFAGASELMKPCAFIREESRILQSRLRGGRRRLSFRNRRNADKGSSETEKLTMPIDCSAET
jgi:hypothetical protein